MEKWKAVVGYEGLYEVSDEGNVRSVDRVVGTRHLKGRSMKLKKDKYGYLTVGLCMNGRHKYLKIHRLVALAHIPNENDKPHVNHLDEIKHHNHVDNLSWCTPKENANHGTGIARHSEARKNHKAMSKPVEQLTLDGELVASYPSMSEAVRSGFDLSRIWCCCNGQRNKHKNFRWRYADATKI
jgi:hypothetical protein